MRLILIWILLIACTYADDIQAQENVDTIARNQAYRNSVAIEHLREDHKDIMSAIEKLEASNLRTHERYDKILEGNGSTGLKEEVHVNTAFRQDVMKFVWIVIGLLATQLGSTLFLTNRTQKLIKLTKE